MVLIDVRVIIFMGGIIIWQLLIILVIVVLLFCTKRLKGIGTDLGGANKGFKKAVSEGEKDAEHGAIQSRPNHINRRC